MLCASFLHAKVQFSRPSTGPLLLKKAASEPSEPIVLVTELRGGSRTMFGNLLGKVSMAMRRVLGPYLPKAWAKRGSQTGGYAPPQKRYGARNEEVSTSSKRTAKKGSSESNRIQKVGCHTVVWYCKVWHFFCWRIVFARTSGNTKLCSRPPGQLQAIYWFQYSLLGRDPHWRIRHHIRRRDLQTENEFPEGLSFQASQCVLSQAVPKTHARVYQWWYMSQYPG